MSTVGQLVPSIGAPKRCPQGHPLRPDRTLVRAIACSCGSHTAWRCHCGAVIHGPPLDEACRLRPENAGLMR